MPYDLLAKSRDAGDCVAYDGEGADLVGAPVGLDLHALPQLLASLISSNSDAILLSLSRRILTPLVLSVFGKLGRATIQRDTLNSAGSFLHRSKISSSTS